MSGMTFQKWGKSVRYPDGEIIIAGQEAEDLYSRESSSVMREGIRDTNFSPLSRSLDFPDSLLGRV